MSAATHTWSSRLSEATETVSLARRAAGSWNSLARKVRRALPTVGKARRRALRRRLQRLQRLGYVEHVPSSLQCALGAVDMMRFFLIPSSWEDQRGRHHSLAFSCVLRFLDDPAAMLDPIGLHSTQDTVVSHLLHVVHAYPLYDLQLLDSFEDGLDELERQLQEVLAGTHPRQDSIDGVVEEREYHLRLLDQVQRHRQGSAEAVNAADRSDEACRQAGATFGSFAGTMRYCTELPTTFRGALRHLTKTRTWSG